MSDRIPGYPDPSFNPEESEAYAPSEAAAEVPEAIAASASSRRSSGPQDLGSSTSQTPSSAAGRRPNIRQSSPGVGSSRAGAGGGNARAGAGAARTAPRTVAPGYRPRLMRRLFAAGGCALFSILVAWAAVFTVTGQAIDTLSMEAAMRWAESLGAVGSTVTHIISVPAMVAVAGLIVLIAWLRRRPTLAGRALGMIVAANTTTQVAKLLIDRPDFHMSAAILNSLPSGHTTVAMSLALALVMIAPEWFRGPAAWIGYIWTSLVGISVMVFGWHRPADVLVAMAICGFWALILCPLETRVRHGVPAQKTMAVIAMASALITVLGVVYSVWALTPNDLAQMGSGGITYAEFLDALPRRAHVLAGISSFGVVAVAGFVIHEVDRLSAK
ncbi:phosphatase PAP2 family protein [Actinomyces sp. oral taxon 181]|uniref:phosphatase PAP2 family protein n=1 Tax=Actinomyces sp. oral taxon 181 TaxID=712121 RepID=UPI0025C01E2C|nr:phosphatase PAP2 family protein [Actinomyces sp. oral taxon 181]MBS5750307.1 phosphatase PAP2 family protein [Actinomyces sp. oral taxon 181]